MAARTAIAIKIGIKGEESSSSEALAGSAAEPCSPGFADDLSTPAEALPGLPWPAPFPLPVLAPLSTDEPSPEDPPEPLTNPDPEAPALGFSDELFLDLFPGLDSPGIVVCSGV